MYFLAHCGKRRKIKHCIISQYFSIVKFFGITEFWDSRKGKCVCEASRYGMWLLLISHRGMLVLLIGLHLARWLLQLKGRDQIEKTMLVILLSWEILPKREALEF